jgi:hypothetical protein
LNSYVAHLEQAPLQLHLVHRCFPWPPMAKLLLQSNLAHSTHAVVQGFRPELRPNLDSSNT